MKKNIARGIRLIAEKRGFTLLIAALVASIVLSLGASIYTIASKEVALSAIGRDSQFAFYAADTAAECALYWDARSDINPHTFATSSNSSISSVCTSSQCPLSCNGVTASSPNVTETASAATTTYELDSLFSSKYCADVTVAKYYDPSAKAEHTDVTANGYNVNCTTLVNAPNAAALQRSVELHY